MTELQALIQAIGTDDIDIAKEIKKAISTSTAHYLNDVQVEAQYGLSRPWLRLKRRQGSGPAFTRIAENGGKILYQREAIESYLKSKKVVNP